MPAGCRYTCVPGGVLPGRPHNHGLALPPCQGPGMGAGTTLVWAGEGAQEGAAARAGLSVSSDLELGFVLS